MDSFLVIGFFLVMIYFVSLVLSKINSNNRKLSNEFIDSKRKVSFGNRWFQTSDNQWHTISCGHDGSNFDFFIDGTILKTYSFMESNSKHDPELKISVSTISKFKSN